MRLDRFLSNLPRFSRADARLLLAAGRLRVDGATVRDGRHEIREFSRIELDDELLQAGKPARYFMLNKPAGVVSATEHAEHRTVLDLLDEPDKHELHIGGRLDLNTTGLLLITNDGMLAHQLLSPARHVWKEYLAVVDGPLLQADADAFAAGLTLSDFTAMPAELQILESTPDEAKALVRVREGKFHQVKRMFHAQGREVLQLHRQTFGPLRLTLTTPGEWRPLTGEEIAALRAAAQGI